MGEVVQLHSYSGIVIEKEGNTMMLMWCRTTGIIMEGKSRTHPVHMFIHRKAEDVLPNLLTAGWKVLERYDDVDVREVE